MALKPLEFAERIYRFVGLEFNAKVKQWIGQNTRKASSTELADPFSTNRNSMVTVESWKSRLNFQEILRIQKDCAAVMEMYGYKPVRDKMELSVSTNAPPSSGPGITIAPHKLKDKDTATGKMPIPTRLSAGRPILNLKIPNIFSQKLH